MWYVFAKCWIIVSIFCFCDLDKINPAVATEQVNVVPINTKIEFPNQLPNSRIGLPLDLVDKLNAMEHRNEQIQYLINLLPGKDAKSRVLADEQLHVIRLLGLTESALAIPPLIERLDFGHKTDGWPAMHALVHIGEIAVEPLVAELEKTSDAQRVSICIGALREIKGKKYPDFEKQLLNRKDNKLSEQTRKQIQTVSEFLQSIKF